MFKYFAESELSDVSNNDRVRIQLGYKPNYSNIQSIYRLEEPMVFDGTKYFDTNVKLMSEDKDWTLFLDIQFIESATNSVLVSCYNDVMSMGFQVKNAYNATSTYPFISYGGDAATGGSNSNTTDSNSNWGWSREVFVITHKKGDTFITTYTGFLNELQPRKKKLVSIVDQTHQMPLILGAQKKANGAVTAYGKGIVHHCEVWDQMFGENECIKMAMWPRETAEFTIVSFGGHPTNTAGTQITKIDFVAAQSTWSKIPYFRNKSDKPTSFSFFDSAMCEWLNTRFLQALPTEWQSALSEPYIRSSKLDTTTEMATLLTNEKTKIWIPSVNELALDIAAIPWSNEGNEIPLFSGDSLQRRMSPGCYTADVYSPSADWVFIQDTDPVADGRNVVPGAIWKTNANNK